VYAVLSAALLLLVSILALTARQPPPPSVAEFAPQSVEQIKNAPNAQSSRFGNGDGGGADGTGGTTTTAPSASTSTTAPKAIDKARVRHCIGDPPRQIEDPQSPPCVAYWEGTDNGGATSFGVSEAEVRIAVPNWDDSIHPALQTFFNSRFEFYGRKLKLVKLGGSNSSDDPSAQEADAVKAHSEVKPFASLDYNGGNVYYYRKLARLGIVAASSQPIFTAGDLAGLSPFVWQYPMGVDRMYANLGEWACKRLVGHKAVHGGPAEQGKDRKFGIIQQFYSADDQPSLEPLTKALQSCGAAVAPPVRYVYDLDPQKAANAVLQMKSADVTSVICLCQVLSMGNMAKSATGQGYFPEWLVSTYLLLDYNALFSASIPPEQRVHAFGLSFIPKQVRPSDYPAGWAMREGDPRVSPRTTAVDITPLNIEYRTLLLIASGIQMAGPHLTPQTFAAALERTVFPNPDTSIFAGHVGFPPALGHGMTVDAAEIWWGEGRTGPTSDNTNGAFCYVDHGARRVAGRYPLGGDPFFADPCDTGA
jgi:hypothetical protein